MTYQLPPETVHFVDRESEQDRALRAVTDWSAHASPLCLSLSGLAGAGKTELAFRIARSLRDRFPDGVLYVDLDDVRRDGAVEVNDVLGDLLRSLGVETDWLELDFPARHRQYWSQTDGKRVVLVVDNARYGAEVAPLLPASGGSMVLLTSHGPLYDLPGGGAVELPLPPLDDPHAGRLLRLAVEDPRLDTEPEATDGLVRLCSGLPAALHVAARWVRKHRRRPLSRLLDELTVELHTQGLPAVERVWDAAYGSLGPHAATLYRLLAGCPGRSATPQAAAALLGRGRDAGDDALEELETAGLLHGTQHRVRLSELLRAHAERRARHDGDEAEAADARRRIVRWYLRQAQRADAYAAGARLTLAAAPTAEPLPRTEDVRFADKPEALRWLDTERHALYDCVRAAHAHGLDSEAWALCEPLWTHSMDHPHHNDVIGAFQTGLAAAQRAEDVRAIVRMRCQLARPLWEKERYEEADEQLAQAFNGLTLLSDEDDDRKLGASAVEFRGMLHGARGEWQRAAAEFERARHVHEAIENPYGVMLQTYRLGEAVSSMGEWERAADLLEQAHTAARDQRRERMTARTGVALAQAYRRVGHREPARELYQAALASARARGAGVEEERTLEALASLAEEDGDGTVAAEFREAAEAVRARHGGLARGPDADRA